MRYVANFVSADQMRFPGPVWQRNGGTPCGCRSVLTYGGRCGTEASPFSVLYDALSLLQVVFVIRLVSFWLNTATMPYQQLRRAPSGGDQLPSVKGRIRLHRKLVCEYRRDVRTETFQTRGRRGRMGLPGPKRGGVTYGPTLCEQLNLVPDKQLLVRKAFFGIGSYHIRFSSYARKASSRPILVPWPLPKGSGFLSAGGCF